LPIACCLFERVWSVVSRPSSMVFLLALNMDNPKKKTVLIGASDNPARYSYLALNRLKNNGHPIVAIGRKETVVAGIPIQQGLPNEAGVDTVSLYLNPAHQKMYYDYIVSLNPKRIIFNPGTENDELADLAKTKGIKTIEACTLVMLSTGQY
jgi:predicted CoA-binding protein